jgi:hypothetical protein
MSSAKFLLGFVTLVFVAALNAAVGYSPQSVPKIQSGGTSSALSGVGNPTAYSVPDRGAATYNTLGSGSLTVGYARVQPNTGSTTPAGYLTFSYRTNGVLVSETSVPISSPIAMGRIYSVVGNFGPGELPTNTGVAMVNPSSVPVTVTFYFTDASGQNFGNNSFVLQPNSQIAKFVNEAPFNCCGSGGVMNGTMTFSSTVPVAVIALQGSTNQRGEFLMTTLPVTDLSVALSTDVLFFPHYAVNGGWETDIVLVNPTDSRISGNVLFLGGGCCVGRRYIIESRSSQKVFPLIEGPSTVTGAINVVPDTGTVSPSGLLIFSFGSGSGTITEAGVPLLRAGGAFRMYETDGGSYPGQLQTGVAIANPSSTSPATVTLELTDLAGRSTGMTSTVTIPQQGQTARFMKQFPGFESIPYPFRGAVRISTPASQGIAVIGLRGEYNERSDFLITTSMPASEATPPSSAEAFFPHLADGGGYTTEFVLFSGSPGQTASGLLRFFTQSGVPSN